MYKMIAGSGSVHNKLGRKKMQDIITLQQAIKAS